VQPRRELTATKSKENQGKRLGFPCILLVESGLFNGLWRKNKKNPLPAQLACQVAREHWGLDGIPRASRTSDPSIVNWLPQKDISYFSAFVNELDGA
jgi:hypothetical protein